MALFDDIIADVFTITNRPDLLAETKLGIRAAVIKLHGLEFWREDRIEEEVAVTVSNSEFSILTTTLDNSVRKIDSIKKINSDVYFEEIDPKQILDGFGYRRYNSYYRMGNLLNFLTDSSDTSVIVIYYKQPTASEAGFSSWIAETYPILVALEAASFVFSSIGDKEQEAKIKGMIADHGSVLIINHLDSISANN